MQEAAIVAFLNGFLKDSMDAWGIGLLEASTSCVALTWIAQDSLLLSGLRS